MTAATAASNLVRNTASLAAPASAGVLVMGLLAAHGTARGALGVLLVVVPLELLGLGASGVGFLNATVGVGAFVGAFAVTGLAGRRCLAAPMGRGLLLTGGSLVVAATLSLTPVVLVAMAVMGAGFALVGITGSTLLVRSARDDVLARVLGVLGTVRAGGIALGAGPTPVLLGLVGVRWTMAAVGAAVVAVSLAGRCDRRRLGATGASATAAAELAGLRRAAADGARALGTVDGAAGGDAGDARPARGGGRRRGADRRPGRARRRDSRRGGGGPRAGR